MKQEPEFEVILNPTLFLGWSLNSRQITNIHKPDFFGHLGEIPLQKTHHLRWPHLRLL